MLCSRWPQQPWRRRDCSTWSMQAARSPVQGAAEHITLHFASPQGLGRISLCICLVLITCLTQRSRPQKENQKQPLTFFIPLIPPVSLRESRTEPNSTTDWNWYSSGMMTVSPERKSVNFVVLFSIIIPAASPCTAGKKVSKSPASTHSKESAASSLQELKRESVTW